MRIRFANEEIDVKSISEFKYSYKYDTGMSLYLVHTPTELKVKVLEPFPQIVSDIYRKLIQQRTIWLVKDASLDVRDRFLWRHARVSEDKQRHPASYCGKDYQKLDKMFLKLIHLL